MDNCNDSVTDFCHIIHGRTPAEAKFLKKALKINVERRIPFCYNNFPELTRENFRQLIRRVKDCLELVSDSKPRYWKIKGIRVPGEREFVTLRPTGVGNNFLELLFGIDEQPAKIHDVKIMFDSDLHQFLDDGKFPMNTHNKCRIIKLDSPDPNTTLKVLVYPKTVQVDIGCTYMPIVWDLSGLIHLISVLGELRCRLTMLSNSQASIPATSSWMVTHFHFGKDGLQSLSSKSFHYTWEDVAGGLVRFYSKTLPNGKNIPRVEQIQTRKISLKEIVSKMVSVQE